MFQGADVFEVGSLEAEIELALVNIDLSHSCPTTGSPAVSAYV